MEDRNGRVESVEVREYSRVEEGAGQGEGAGAGRVAASSAGVRDLLRARLQGAVRLVPHLQAVLHRRAGRRHRRPLPQPALSEAHAAGPAADGGRRRRARRLSGGRPRGDEAAGRAAPQEGAGPASRERRESRAGHPDDGQEDHGRLH